MGHISVIHKNFTFTRYFNPIMKMCIFCLALFSSYILSVTAQVLVRYSPTSSNRFAYLLISSLLVNIIKYYYTASYNRGGALAANGYENVIFFKYYLISKPKPGRIILIYKLKLLDY